MVVEKRHLSSGADADSLDRVLWDRALPGVLIFDMQGRLEYISNDARRMLSIINTENHIPDEKGLIPEEIHRLYSSSRRDAAPGTGENDCPGGTLICNGNRYTIRSVDLYEAQDGERPACVMVIIEKCSPGRNLNADLEGARKRFGLTGRELEVVEGIINGATNNDLSLKLSISEHTVKDYVKRIIRKMDVKNRSSILSRIME